MAAEKKRKKKKKNANLNVYILLQANTKSSFNISLRFATWVLFYLFQRGEKDLSHN